MNNFLANEQEEIIEEFVQETQDMIEQLEPTIIELGQSCRPVNCWKITECGNLPCPRYEKQYDFPCWLHCGYIESVNMSCPATSSKQGCIECDVFQLTNGNNATINAIFRLFHSMKGSAGFLDMKNISSVAHSAENLLDLIRSGSIKMDSSHVDILCDACDFSKAALEYLVDNMDDVGMLDSAADVSEKLKVAIVDAKRRLSDSREIALAGGEAKPDSPQDVSATSLEEPDNVTEEEPFTITTEMVEQFVAETEELLLSFEQGLLKWLNDLDNTDVVAELFRNIHSFKGDCGFFGFECIEKLTHDMETTLDAVKADVNIDKHKTAKVLLEFCDVLKSAVSNVADGGDGDINNLHLYLDVLESLLPKGWLDGQGNNEEKVPVRLGDILVEQGVVAPEDIEAALEEQRKPIGQILIDKGVVTEPQISKALRKQDDIRPKPEMKPKSVAPKSVKKVAKQQDIRVSLNKLDSLINLIGELVIAENVVVNNPDLTGLELENFNKASQQMDKIIRDLQEVSMVIRMVPVAGLFRRMIRLVHDLSSKAGKKVDFKLIGEETEVDKTVIEIITDPLVHLIRNSLDHGLEQPDERIATGKTATGHVTLTASHEEGEVWIIIEDDGRGLNREKIIEKAITKGLINGDGVGMSDKEIFALVFHAGFSTAEKITDVSGRGVGMDVVNQNLQKINGRIEIQSKAGHGTKVTLRIPLTLAII